MDRLEQRLVRLLAHHWHRTGRFDLRPAVTLHDFVSRAGIPNAKSFHHLACVVMSLMISAFMIRILVHLRLQQAAEECGHHHFHLGAEFKKYAALALGAVSGLR